MRRLGILLAVSLGLGCSAAFAATLNVGSWHLWAGSQTLTKGTCTLAGTSSTTDTYVDEKNPATSNGASTTLSVSPRSLQRRWTLIRFDLSSCNIPATGGADAATLSVRMTAAPASTRTIDVAPVLTTWSGSSTWVDAQTLTFGSTTATFATGTTNNVTKSVSVTGDVDALIKDGAANYGWRLSDSGTAANVTATFGAADNATAGNRPQLVIDYEK